ncbi:integrase [Bradyrhizobium phage BDU-MI-1]|nr:integrase [Bradyrhizobium phage BDU-MI-1]
MLRVTSNGAKSYGFKYKIPGTQNSVTLTIGSADDWKLEAARARANEFRDKLKAGQDPRLEVSAEKKDLAQRAGTTFNAMCDSYIEEYAKPNKSSWSNDVQLLRRPRAKFGTRIADSITDDEWATFLRELATTAPVQANRTQSQLYTVYSWAKQPGRKYVSANPLDGLKQSAKELSRERVLSDDEVRTLWTGLDHPDCPSERPIRLALKLILVTMVRPGQSAGGEASELVNFKTKEPEWHIPKVRVKKRRDIIVPLSPLAVEVIKVAIEDDDQLVFFPSKFGDRDAIERNSLSQALTGIEGRPGIRKFLKMDHFTPHDLRRTAATIARRGGAPRDHVEACLDHIEGDVTAVYDKYNMLPEKRAAQMILDRELRKILGAKRTRKK